MIVFWASSFISRDRSGPNAGSCRNCLIKFRAGMPVFKSVASPCFHAFQIMLTFAMGFPKKLILVGCTAFQSWLIGLVGRWIRILQGKTYFLPFM